MASLSGLYPLFRTVGNHVRFRILRKYSYEASHIRDYIEEALNQSDANDIDFVPFRIRQYVLGNRFSNANVDMVQYLEDINGNIRCPSSVTKEELGNGSVFTESVKFSSLFERGFDCVLQQYNSSSIARNGKSEIIDDPLLQFAVQSFISGFLYYKDHHERCLRSVHHSDEETTIAVLLANHLFSRLAATTPGSTYFVTNDYHSQFKFCPCEYQCGDEILYENSGIGTELLWYGRPDIMVFPLGGSCSIVLPKDKHEENCPDNEDHEEQVIEVKNESKLLRDRINVSQFVSQVITHSLYQKQYQLRRPDYFKPVVTLIPTIAVTDKCFDIYLYDTEHDILFRNYGDPIPLWNNLGIPADATLNLGAVLQLWMLVNHLSIKPKLTQEQLEKFSKTCGFTSTLPNDHLKRIETDVGMRAKFFDHAIEEIRAPKMSLKSKYLKSYMP